MRGDGAGQRAAPCGHWQAGGTFTQIGQNCGVLGEGGIGQRAAIQRGKAPRLPPIGFVDCLPAHHHHRAILGGDGDIAAAGEGLLHPFAKGGHTQMVGRDHRQRGRAVGVALLLGAIDALVGTGDREIVPIVGDDAAARGVHAGEDGGMARAGLGSGVALIGRGEHRASHQPGQPAGIVLAILREEIGGELIHRDGDEQLGRIGRGRGRGRVCGGGCDRGRGIGGGRTGRPGADECERTQSQRPCAGGGTLTGMFRHGLLPCKWAAMAAQLPATAQSTP